MKGVILLSIRNYSGSHYRIGLFKTDFLSYVKNKNIENVFISLDGVNNICVNDNILTYIHHGSLLNESISEWVSTNNLQKGSERLLFELTIENNTHYYHFLGTEKFIKKLFDTHKYHPSSKKSKLKKK